MYYNNEIYISARVISELQYILISIFNFRAIFHFNVPSALQKRELFVKVIATKCEEPYLMVAAKADNNDKVFIECMLLSNSIMNDCRFRCSCGCNCKMITADAGAMRFNNDNILCEIEIVN